MPEVEDVLEMDFLELGEPVPETPQTPPQQPEDTGEEEETITEPENTEDKDEGKKPEPVKTPTGNERIEQTDDSGEDDDPDNPDNSDDSDDPGGEDQTVSLYEEMINNSGLEFTEEEKAALLEAEETPDGFNQVSNTIAEKKAEKRFLSLIEQYPETAKVLQYEMNGGDPRDYFDTFYPEVDYSEIEVADDDVDTQKQIVAESLRLQGLEAEDIESELDDLETAGILSNRAKRSLKTLQKHQAQEKKQFQQKQQQLEQQRQEAAEKQYNDAKEIVTKGDLNGVKIPQDKADDFMNYLFTPVTEDGKSQAAVDSQKLGLEERLLIGYLHFSGYDLNKFVQQQTNNGKVKNIREVLDKSKNNTKLKGAGEKDKSTAPKGNYKDIESPFL